MGREIIGECSGSGEDAQLDELERSLTLKYIQREAGEPEPGVSVEVSWEDHELGSYPVISVVWDDFTVEYPDEYIGKCIDAYERFEFPEEIYERWRKFGEIQDGISKLYEMLEDALKNRR